MSAEYVLVVAVLEERHHGRARARGGARRCGGCSNGLSLICQLLRGAGTQYTNNKSGFSPHETNQRAPSGPEAHACPPAQPSIEPVVYSRCWLCRALDTSLIPLVPRPNTGLKCNGGQGVAPPSTTAAAGSLLLKCCASPLLCDEGARCSAPDQDVDCYTVSVNRSQTGTREACLDSQD